METENLETLTSNPQLLAAVIAAAIMLLIAVVAWWRWYASTPQRIRRALREISHDLMEDFFLSDAMGGHIHIDFLLLTNRGLLVLDMKNIAGVIFGADQMDEWVLMNGSKRHGFRNPLYALHDRVATVRTHARDTHTEGYVVFTDHGRFEKGVPSETVMLSHLVETIGPAGDDYPQAFAESWRQLQKLAEQAQEETQPPRS